MCHPQIEFKRTSDGTNHIAYLMTGHKYLIQYADHQLSDVAAVLEMWVADSRLSFNTVDAANLGGRIVLESLTSRRRNAGCGLEFSSRWDGVLDS